MRTQQFVPEKIEKRPHDFVLLVTVAILALTGIAVMLSASIYHGERLFGDPMHFFRRQLLFLLIGTICAAILYFFPLGVLRALRIPVLVGTLILMGLTYVPGLGVHYLGARRWIFVFGSSFQPSEVVKPAVVLFLAHFLARHDGKLDDVLNSVLPPMLVVVTFAMLTVGQNDFSTAILIVGIALVMLFVAGTLLRYFVGIVVMVVPIGLLLLLSKEHRVLRVLSFIDPWSDPAGAGYQVLASQRALQSGGLWGLGIGQSTRKFGELPEAYSDFVFAVFGEEFGFVGIVLALVLFGLLAYRGIVIALQSVDPFNRYLAFGLTAAIVGQAILNMAVVSGLVPATGIPLPFFSTGGSSLLVTLCMSGVLLNLSRVVDQETVIPVFGAANRVRTKPVAVRLQMGERVNG